MCEGRGMDFGGETEGVALLRRSAYVGMCESGRDERQAGWHRRSILRSCPCKRVGTGALCRYITATDKILFHKKWRIKYENTGNSLQDLSGRE